VFERTLTSSPPVIKTVTSYAYADSYVVGPFISPDTEKPVSLALKKQSIGLIARQYNCPEIGHPCLIPRWMGIGQIKPTPTFTIHEAPAYSKHIQDKKKDPQTQRLSLF
jgi:hypothetical protein